MGYGKIIVEEDVQNHYPERMDMFLEFLMDKTWDMKKLGNNDVEFTVQGEMFNGETKEDAQEYVVLFDDEGSRDMIFRKRSEIVAVEIGEDSE